MYILSLSVLITKKVLGIIPINLRPNGAKYCDSYSGFLGIHNSDYSLLPDGFPSGHVANTVFVFLISLYYFNGYYSFIPWITGMFTILVPISRVMMKCHSPFQVVGGISYGIIFSIIFKIFFI